MYTFLKKKKSPLFLLKFFIWNPALWSLCPPGYCTPWACHLLHFRVLIWAALGISTVALLPRPPPGPMPLFQSEASTLMLRLLKCWERKDKFLTFSLISACNPLWNSWTFGNKDSKKLVHSFQSFTAITISVLKDSVIKQTVPRKWLFFFNRILMGLKIAGVDWIWSIVRTYAWARKKLLKESLFSVFFSPRNWCLLDVYRL